MEGESEQREEERKSFSTAFQWKLLVVVLKDAAVLSAESQREKSRVAAYDNVICKCDPQVLSAAGCSSRRTTD